MSFSMHTDRYPDNKHKKFQIDTLIRNAFSVKLNLANNPKIKLCVRYDQQLRSEPSGQSHTMAASL